MMVCQLDEDGQRFVYRIVDPNDPDAPIPPYEIEDDDSYDPEEPEGAPQPAGEDQTPKEKTAEGKQNETLASSVTAGQNGVSEAK